MKQNRRDFIKFSFAGAAFGFIPGHSSTSNWAKALFVSDDYSRGSPIQSLDKTSAWSQDFNGDDIEKSHEVLWDIDGFIAKRGGIPKVSESAPVVVIGGGLAGLTACYELRDLNPILLEQDQRFGGNAKGEVFNSSFYTTGSTYLGAADPKSDLCQFLEELDIAKYLRYENAEDGKVFYNNRILKDFWRGSSDPQARVQFQNIFDDLAAIYDQGVIDSLYAMSGPDQNVRNLDRISFAQWLEENYGNVHPHILEYFQLYGWSAFIASIHEISAAQMLSFISAETVGIMALPGGNSMIAQALYDKLSEKPGLSRLRRGSIVVDVRLSSDGVEVCYDDAQGKLHTIKAQQCVFAAPKFIAKRVLQNIPDQQMKAISQINYRAYVVSNIIFDRPIEAPCYELYCLQGTPPPAPTAMQPSDRGFSDLCFASWVQGQKDTPGVLTAYNALAFDGARQFLFSPQAHDKYRQRVLNDLQPVLKHLGLNENNIRGLRMTRWGHAMPVADTGLISSGIAETAHQSIGNRIHFANQDNLANPCFESIQTEVYKACEKIRAYLKA